MEQLSPQEVKAMDYNQLIGVVKETNRPPGGAESVFGVAQRAFLRPTSRVLEIGTSTGFTSIELARLVGCHIDAIDINPPSLEEASRRATQNGVADLIDFHCMDAVKTTFSDEQFDMVFCGNVTSLIPDREKALEEYCRVLRDGGFIAAIPMYYVDKPSDDLIRRVSDAIQVDITPHYRDYWVDFFDRAPLQLYWSRDFRFDLVDDKRVGEFVADILARPHLKELRADTREALEEQYRRFIFLFRENLSMMGYTLMLLRKERYPDDAELFTGSPV
jgi:ubiquinone/menaquinone biosynthesis C-methylase UbiE